MFVLGIDPGLSRCGYGLVRRLRSDYTGVRAGVIKTPPDDPLPQRLASLSLELHGLIAECRPEVVVVERVFFQTNVRTAMSVGQASGLALAAAAGAGCCVAQYTSNEVKMAVTGDGAATKRQVQQMVQTLLRLPEPPRPPDVADALALALCHLALAPRLARIEAAESNMVRGATITEATGVAPAGRVAP
ncbi:MAG TPA: crossover junction endodeoxyribonuclease RuvC [Acidimicrobiales bacterium]|nr:crossover junction endodeoxyribonuclease RuvC [Acidimicrobiales bacterium]